jgi:hypothetical protein
MSTLSVARTEGSAARPSSVRWWVRSMATDRISRMLFVLLATGITLGYTVTLPFASTQRLSLANWQFLTGRLLGFAIALGVGMAMVLTVQVYALRRAAAARRAAAGGAIGGFAMVLSLLPTFLCCTPIIPTVLATVGLSTVGVYSTTGSLQHFFAVHETAFFVASLGLLAATGWWSLRRLARACCLTDTGCAPRP